MQMTHCGVQPVCSRTHEASALLSPQHVCAQRTEGAMSADSCAPNLQCKPYPCR